MNTHTHTHHSKKPGSGLVNFYKVGYQQTDRALSLVHEACTGMDHEKQFVAETLYTYLLVKHTLPRCR